MPATIKQLEETAHQDEVSAIEYDSLAGKHPERYEYFTDLAKLCRANRESVLLTIKATKESAIYNQFGKGDDDER